MILYQLSSVSERAEQGLGSEEKGDRRIENISLYLGFHFSESKIRTTGGARLRPMGVCVLCAAAQLTRRFHGSQWITFFSL